MTVDEAMKWAEDPSGDFISDMDEHCIRTLSREVRRLQTIVSGKTQFDAIAETAERCAKLAESCPPEVTMYGDHKRCPIPRAIAGAIRKTFGLSD